MNPYKIVYWKDGDALFDRKQIITFGEESTANLMDLFEENINYDVHCVKSQTLLTKQYQSPHGTLRRTRCTKTP